MTNPLHGVRVHDYREPRLLRASAVRHEHLPKVQESVHGVAGQGKVARTPIRDSPHFMYAVGIARPIPVPAFAAAFRDGRGCPVAATPLRSAKPLGTERVVAVRRVPRKWGQNSFLPRTTACVSRTSARTCSPVPSGPASWRDTVCTVTPACRSRVAKLRPRKPMPPKIVTSGIRFHRYEDEE